jgi:hypothetical protein
MASIHRAASHERTLGMLFEHPMSGNIEWRQAMALFDALGTVLEDDNGTSHITVNAQTLVLHRSRHKALGEEEIIEIRHFLRRAGVEPPHPTKGPGS